MYTPFIIKNVKIWISRLFPKSHNKQTPEQVIYMTFFYVKMRDTNKRYSLYFCKLQSIKLLRMKLNIELCKSLTISLFLLIFIQFSNVVICILSFMFYMNLYFIELISNYTNINLSYIWYLNILVNTL